MRATAAPAVLRVPQAGGGQAPPPVVRIGPNAITRMAEALQAGLDPAHTEAIFAAAGLADLLARPPEHMVDEALVTRLQQEVRRSLPADAAAAIVCEAGRRTGDYLLAHRIPRLAQAVLRPLPPALASRVLLCASGKHAWTFAGSGAFTARPGRPVVLTVAGCPICKGASAGHAVCDYYAATFERLFQALVSPACRARETDCQAMGAAACRFELDW